MLKKTAGNLITFSLLLSLIIGISFAPSSYAYTYLPEAKPAPAQQKTYTPIYIPISSGFYTGQTIVPNTHNNHNPNPYFNHSSPNPYFRR